MKQHSLCIFFFILMNCAHSQIIKSHEYIGTLRLSTKQLITYKINFTESPDGKIEGTSVTDIYGKNRTQSVIKGKIETNGKISFHETANLTTKSTTSKDNFCYVNVLSANLKSIGGKTLLQGNFIGKYPSGKACAKGDIIMMTTTGIQELGKEFLTSEVITNEDSLKTIKERMNLLLSKSVETYLRRNELMSLHSSASEIALDIWDGGGEEDNDEVCLLVNNKKVGENIGHEGKNTDQKK